MPTDAERREWGRKGGKQRAMNKARRRADPMYAIKEELPGAFAQLVAASKGMGRWKELSVKDQLMALLKVVEYGVGKSITLDKMTPKNPAEDGDGVEKADGIEFN